MSAEVVIWFGSQTGTAQYFAEELGEEAVKRGVNAQVFDLAKFTPERFLACPLTILVVSTYGDGEPTDSAVKFDTWASSTANDGILKGRRFAVMGLGDMNYTRFNNMGKMTYENMTRLGAACIHNRGVGDDSQDIAEDFAKWKEGLWDKLKKTIAEITAEGGYAACAETEANQRASVPVAPQRTFAEVHVFYGVDENDGAAGDICTELVSRLKARAIDVVGPQNLSERKAVEAVKKLPIYSLALMVVDASTEGLCGPARKLLRNMKLEIDPGSLAEKGAKLVQLTVASSKCSNSAAALRAAIAKTAGTPVSEIFIRCGIQVSSAMPEPYYIDAGVEDVPVALDAACDSFARAAADLASSGASLGPVAPPATAAVEAPTKTPAPAPAPAPAKVVTLAKLRLLNLGLGARAAAEALFVGFPVEDASIASLGQAAQGKAELILAVEVTRDGSLHDAARGLAAQLRAIPPVQRMLMRQIRFALLAAAAKDGAASEDLTSELSKVAGAVSQALVSLGAKCVGEASVDLRHADAERLAAARDALQRGFGGAASVQQPAANTQAPVQQMPQNSQAQALPPRASAAVELHIGATANALPETSCREASDTLARFYFDAVETKVVKVRQLRQQPDFEAGLSTVEVELEAIDGLRGYQIGGTLSLLPHNDQNDIVKMLPLLGLKQEDLKKFITFSNAGNRMNEQPFPTPCTLGDALSRFCDLGRAPTRKMLAAVQPQLQDASSRERVAKLLAHPDAVKELQKAPSFCRMHEFMSLIGIKSIDLCSFLLHCPRQKAREFTIASSPGVNSDRISLCVSLTGHEQARDLSQLLGQLRSMGIIDEAATLPDSAGDRGLFLGLTTRWLCAAAREGEKVLAKARPSALKLPEKDVPIIMVGAGAGVAPFKGFWDEIQRGTRQAPASLFFGCRNAEQDWLYKDEMRNAVKVGSGCAALARVGPKRPLAALFTAFSRPGGETSGEYVQHKLRAQATSVKHWLIQLEGVLYVCGSTAMGSAVLDEIAAMLEGGKAEVESMRKSGRIVVEMWG